MIVYTGHSESWLANRSSNTSIGDEINYYVNDVNVAFSQSGANLRVNLVHIHKTPTYNERNYSSSSTVLGHLRSPSDGQMDEIHSLRTKYGADIVILITHNPGAWGGLAYLLEPSTWNRSNRVTYWAQYAFGLVNAGNLNSMSLQHEIGHILGLHHGMGDGSQPRENGVGVGVFSYSQGFRSHDNSVRSIMAYAPGLRKNRFSRPVPYTNIGVTHPLGSPMHDNVRTLNEVAPVFHGMRPQRNWLWRNNIVGGCPKPC